MPHVTQLEIDHAVALATGEPLRAVRSRGFSIVPDRHESPDPEDLALLLDCPFCRAMIPYPALPVSTPPALAVCPACDVEFEFAPHEVYTISTPRTWF
jgi:hypothetical protein